MSKHRVDMEKQKVLVNPPLAQISAVRFFPPGENGEERLLAVTSWDGTFRIYDFQENSLLYSDKCEDGLPILGLATVAPTSFCFGGMDKKVYLLKDIPTDPKDLANEQLCPKVLGSHKSSIMTVEHSEEYRIVVTGSRDGNIILWKWDAPEEERTKPADMIKTGRPGIFCLSVRKHLIAAGLAGGEVGVWDIKNTSEPVKISFVKDDLHLECLALFPDMTRYVYGTAEGKASVECIPKADGKKEFVFKPHIDKVKKLAHPVNAISFFNPRSNRFISAGSDGKCKLWDPDTRTGVAEFSPYFNEVSALHASASGRHLAVGCSYMDDRELAPGTKIPPPSIYIRNIADYLD